MLSNTLSDRPFPVRFWLPAIPIAVGLGLWAAGIDLRVGRHWILETGRWAPLVFVAAGIASLTLLVPKTVVSIVSGAMFGTAFGSLLMCCVAVSAAAINYAIGRWWLHDSIDRVLGKSPRESWFRAIRDVAAESGFRFHFLLRLTPLPTAIISYAMGASGSRLRPFLLAAAMAVLPQSLWVHGGTVVAAMDQSQATPLQWFSIILSVCAAIAISIVVPRLAVKRMERLNHASAEVATE